MKETNGLVPIGQLGTYDNFDPSGFFGNIHDAESAKQAVGKIKVLEEMLRAAEQYGEYASKFCLLEAQMYIQIAQVDGSEEKLTESKRNLVQWIRSKTDEELDEIVSECSFGIRILRIKHREDRKDAERIRSHNVECELKRISDKIVNDAKKNGVTKLSPSVFYEYGRFIGKPDKDIIKGHIERTRDILLANNILGIGDGEGTYVDPVRCDRETISRIVETRLESIYADIHALSKICSDSKFSIPESGIIALHASVSQLAAI